MKHRFLLLFFIISGFVLTAQNRETNTIPNEVLVQFSNKKTAQLFLSRTKQFNVKQTRVISARFHIYLLKINEKQTSVKQLITALSAMKGVSNVQKNHVLSLRETKETFPNDTLFGEQWSLYNDGTQGGTPDADIDATDAWDITTGGLTATGDTIVVAVIDGGADIHHEDVDFWKNYAEIPGNSIDDDNNGYVDDFDGWNAYNDNGNIPLHNHGMHVSGIIGAIGNNHIGVSGVNWTVKILPIAGSSTSEATVVKALSYLYTVRERYDSTNGAQGAFVVSDNCSFGVDKGNPANYPIWEAMYDSLGKLGVLSCAATANKPWDIDSVGDVPTAFSTDFMISVTNTTKRDQLYTSAGWGDTTIDLGSPGTSIKSTLINNGYGYKTGTSMATPHVTGSVALLMAAADSMFTVNFKNRPAEGALLIKNFILEGVDSIPDLIGKTVSGGRLNVYRSMMKLINAPVIETDTDSVYAEAPLNTPVQEQLLLTNAGNDTLFYKIETENQLINWLTVSPDSGSLAGSQQQEITLNFDDEGLDTGYYYTTLHISGRDAFSKDIPVTFYVYDNVGITERKNIGVKLYPNPFTDELKIKVENVRGESLHFEIFDALGKPVLSIKKEAFNGSRWIILPVESLAAGIYYFRLSSGENRLIKTGKVVKMNP